MLVTLVVVVVAPVVVFAALVVVVATPVVVVAAFLSSLADVLRMLVVGACLHCCGLLDDSAREL